MSADEAVRIGDAERERAQAVLGDHYAEGRLDHDEYSERLDRIWAARTPAELAPVFSDLPGFGPIRPASYPFSTPATRGLSRAARRRSPGVPLPLLVLLVVLASVFVATNVPVVLIGLGVWFFFLRGGGCSPRRPVGR